MKINRGSHAEMASKRLRTIQKWIIFSVAAAGLLIFGALIILPSLNTNQTGAPGSIRTSTTTDPAPMDAAPVLGPQNAPVTIIEYADFGCPACWYWYKVDILDQLRTVYGDQIRFVWRDYPVVTILSPKAAEAGQCANEQGKFWEFHNAVYDNDRAIEASDLKAYAVKIGLNMSQFNQCVSSRRYRDRVNAEQEEAFSHGFNAVPFFLVNNQLVIGPQSLAYFVNLIDPLLAAKK